MSYQPSTDVSEAFSTAEEECDTSAIEYGDLWSMYKTTINGLWTSDFINVADDVVTWRGGAPVEVKKCVLFLLDILTETSMLPMHEVIRTVCEEVNSLEVHCFFSAQSVIERRHAEALSSYRSLVAYSLFEPTPSDSEEDSDSDIEAEENAKKIELVEANCNWLADWLEEQTTFAERLIALGAGWRITSCTAYALLVWFIEEKDIHLPGLREIIRLIARDIDNHVDFISLLVYHLVDRPSLREVRRIVAGAIKMEKACATDPYVVEAKLAPTLLSVFTSRLSKSRPQSPQPPGAMGQQPSKKSKKSGKDKDKDLATDGTSTDPHLDGTDENSAHDSSSRQTGVSTVVGSELNGVPNGTPSINVSDPAGAPVSSTGSSSGPHGSPYPPKASIPSIDHSPQASTSAPSPHPSPKPATAPLDIPVPTQTILSNATTPLSPSSMNSNGNGATGESVGNGGAKDKLKQLDVDDMIQRLLDVGYTGKVSKSLCLKNTEITAICLAARDIFLSQPTLIELSPPVKIVGDVHGQYSDLIRLFEMCGFPPAANYLFLGDYVDRGKQSLETILLLLCYKIKYPENFFLLRGNHECANVTRVYGFYDECKRRCNIKTWKTFIDVFNCLPIAAIVASKIFCVHGGLSPSLHSMEDIKRIQRPTDVPDYGLLNDLLWSDPSDTALDWEDNERGVSYCFGKAIINEFLVRYDMDLICRAHMVVEDGYEFWNDRTLVTVFSAPNYCGEFDNYGACMSVSEDLLCAFELLKPLDGAALRKEMTKAKRKSVMATAS